MTQAVEPEDTPGISRARARLGTLLQEKWTLDSLLGVGGMAAVYGATHRNGKRVAIKMLHSELSHDEEIRQRFLQEGYAANAIQHDGAVSVLDDDVAPDGSAFIVMELLEGETVERRWEQGGQRLPVGKRSRSPTQLLDVLRRPTTRASCTATSSPRTSSSRRPARSRCSTSASPRCSSEAVARYFDAGGHHHGDARVHGARAGARALGSGRRQDRPVGRRGDALHAALGAARARGPVEPGAAHTERDDACAGVAQRGSGRSGRRGQDRRSRADFEQSARWPDARAMQQAVRVALDAHGGPDPAAGGGRSATGTLVSRDTVPEAAHPRAATMIDTTRTASSVAAWTREREARLAEATKLRASIADLQQRALAAKKQVAEAETKVGAGRAERASLEQWFKRQTGTRTAAVEAARKEVRRKMVALARKAIADRDSFGPDFDPARQQIAKLDGAARSAERDVAVHVAAVEAYDRPSLRSGVVLLGVGAVLLLALLLGPIVWRATRVIDPGPPPSGEHGVRGERPK